MLVLVLPLATFACCLVLRWAPIPAAVPWTLLMVLLVACAVVALAQPDSRGTILAAGALSGLAGLIALGGGVIVASLRRAPPGS